MLWAISFISRQCRRSIVSAASIACSKRQKHWTWERHWTHRAIFLFSKWIHNESWVRSADGVEIRRWFYHRRLHYEMRDISMAADISCIRIEICLRLWELNISWNRSEQEEKVVDAFRDKRVPRDDSSRLFTSHRMLDSMVERLLVGVGSLKYAYST